MVVIINPMYRAGLRLKDQINDRKNCLQSQNYTKAQLCRQNPHFLLRYSDDSFVVLKFWFWKQSKYLKKRYIQFFVFTNIFAISGTLHFFLYFWIAIYCTFPSDWRSSFSISLWGRCASNNFSRFSFIWKCLQFHLHFWKSFTGGRMTVFAFVSFFVFFLSALSLGVLFSVSSFSFLRQHF